jgi:two-component system sensor histidine kinase AlgZ
MKRLYWICQIAGWGAYASALFAVTTAYSGWRVRIAFAYVLFFLYSIALTHLLRREIQRRDWLSLPAARGLPLMLAAALAVGITQTALVVTVGRVLSAQSGFDDARQVGATASGIVVATCAWTAAYIAAAWNRRYRETRFREMQLQITLGQSELRALRAQVNPHFLFNCLNTIRGMIGENPVRAQDMVTNLANMFRHAIECGGAQMVPLKDEIQAVSEYLALESARFEERLRVEMAVSQEAARWNVPAMVLQTLVENAVKHGISDLPNGGLLTIRAATRKEELILEVENTGRLKDLSPNRTHTGLANARERLRLLCGEKASLELSDTGMGLVAATVVIPGPA